MCCIPHGLKHAARFLRLSAASAMAMDQRASYLYERIFHPDRKKRRNPEKVKFWRTNLGEEFFDRICSHYPQTEAYIRDQEYDAAGMDGDFRSVEAAGSAADRVIEKFLLAHSSEDFISFYGGYLKEALGTAQQLPEMLSGTPKLCESYLFSILSRLKHICVRTLIYELHRCKSRGELKGRDVREEYEYFCNEIMTSQWKRQLEGRYPLLKRSIREAIQDGSRLYLLTLRRLEQDHEEIRDILCKEQEFSHALDITGGIADFHRGGQSVLKVHLDNGCTVIYKPHSLDNERYFEELADSVGKACGRDMKRVPRICRKDYGWEGCIERKPCRTKEEVSRFYERTGILMFLFYLLGTNDLHGENIIACGEYPVVVDLENLLGMPDDIDESNIMEKVKLYLHTSVLYSGMLPAAKWQQDGGSVNVSGIGGGGNVRMPFKVPGIAGSGTSDIRITYYYPEIAPDQNTPVYQGVDVSPAQYEQQIREGFAQAYRFAMAHTERLETMLESLRAVKSRYLAADTQRYAMCLNSSYHPSLMTDGADRQLYLYTMCYGRNLDKPGVAEIVSREVRDLAAHDIPYFYFHVDERHLYDSRHQPVKEYFRRTAFDVMMDRFAGLSEEDLKHQERLIYMALVLPEQITVNRRVEGIPKAAGASGMLPEGDVYLKIADSILEKLLEYAVHFGGEYGWYAANIASFGASGMQIEPVHMYLYGGVMGIALIAHEMELCTGNGKYAELCQMLDGQLFAYTRQLSGMHLENLRAGIYNGEMSVVYGYLCLYRLTGREKYLQYAMRHGDLILPAIRQVDTCDFLDGLAGVIWGMLMLYEISGEEKYLKAARLSGDLVCEKACHMEVGAGWRIPGEERPLLGISHGNAGIAAALARLYDVTKEEGCYDLLKEALACENHFYSEELENWADFRVREEALRKQTDTVAWCHGAGGILASRLMMRKLVGEDLKEMIEKDIERAAGKLKNGCLREGMCLCHGSCGNVLLLSEYDKDSRAVQAYDAYICGKMLDGYTFLPQEEYHPGLMNGFMGVAYYMLKRYDDNFINILMLE